MFIADRQAIWSNKSNMNELITTSGVTAVPLMMAILHIIASHFGPEPENHMHGRVKGQFQGITTS